MVVVDVTPALLRIIADQFDQQALHSQGRVDKLMYPLFVKKNQFPIYDPHEGVVLRYIPSKDFDFLARKGLLKKPVIQEYKMSSLSELIKRADDVLKGEGAGIQASSLESKVKEEVRRDECADSKKESLIGQALKGLGF